MKAQDIRTLTALAHAKAHMEALRRIQLAFEKEIGDASIKHHCTEEKYTKLQQALSTINEVFSAAETSIDTSYDNLKFNLEYELEKNDNKIFTIQYEIETKDDIITRDFTGVLDDVKQRFKHVVYEAYGDGILHSTTLYRGESHLISGHNMVVCGYTEVENYLNGDAK